MPRSNRSTIDHALSRGLTTALPVPVAGLPLSLSTGISWKLAPTPLEDFPTCLDFTPVRLLCGYQNSGEPISSSSWLDMSAHVPHKTCQLTGNRSDDFRLRLVDRREPPVSLTQPGLRLPPDGSDLFRESFNPHRVASFLACRQAMGLCGLEHHGARFSVPRVRNRPVPAIRSVLLLAQARASP